MLLKNKVAIVTGGNSGIGKAIVLEFARQGANVTIDYVSHADATDELEKQTGPKPQHAEELKRIDKLTWWDDVSAGGPGFPHAGGPRPVRTGRP